ncbi:MerR family transcriptional regulator, partial [Streptomyces sp. NPDC016845]|uniref:MerR family transcriptional regulator n=1 Tax=Streptomyces sp. NPDC016845 TaxID=3364972 RepID=UPI0037BB6A62
MQRSSGETGETGDGAGITSGSLARRLGVSPTTLRSWDQRYDLGPAGRGHGRHRRWSPRDVAMLEDMCRLTATGIPPAEAARVAKERAGAARRDETFPHAGEGARGGEVDGTAAHAASGGEGAGVGVHAGSYGEGDGDAARAASGGEGAGVGVHAGPYGEGDGDAARAASGGEGAGVGVHAGPYGEGD